MASKLLVSINTSFFFFLIKIDFASRSKDPWIRGDPQIRTIHYYTIVILNNDAYRDVTKSITFAHWYWQACNIDAYIYICSVIAWHGRNLLSKSDRDTRYGWMGRVTSYVRRSYEMVRELFLRNMYLPACMYISWQQ